MKTKFLILSLALYLLASCATSPEGRRQLHLLSQSQLDSMGEQSFAELKKNTPLTDKANVRNYVQCVANHIIPQLKNDPNPASWEIQVFADPQANAFALPGRKIGVYEGLLKYAQNKNQLAAVIGHELAHVIAEHSNERVSNQLAANAGLSIAAIILGSTQESDKRLLMAGLGLGVQYGVLMPFSRSHESEADLIGLDLMARSGFDPRESVQLWRNMSQAGGGGPEFLSTHPSGDTRIKDLSARMPKAMALYTSAQQSGKRPNCSL
jgi:predicted Zn-dependent protease